MKRFLLVLALVGVAGATYIAAAPGSQTAGPTAAQFAALKRQVAGLKKQVKGVKTLAQAEAKLLTDCMVAAVPIRPYGDYTSPTGPTYGYSYSDPSINSGTPFPQTALNLTPSDDPAARWITVGPSTCGVDLGTARRNIGRLAGLRVHRVTPFFGTRRR